MTPTGTKRPSEEDERYARDPDQDQFEDLINQNYTSAEEQAAEKRAKQGADDDNGGSDKDLDNLKDQENAGTGNKQDSDLGSQEDQPWQTNSSRGASAGSIANAASRYKKAGIIAGILATVVMSVLGLLYGLVNSFVVNFKENYYEWSMKRGYTRTAQRAAHNFEKKYFSDPAECEGIRCRYRSGVTRGQIRDLERKGVTVNATSRDDVKKGRFVINSITLPDGTELTRANYLQQFQSNRLVRSYHAKMTDISGTFTRTTNMVTKINTKLKMTRQNPLRGEEDKKGFKAAMRRYLIGESGTDLSGRSDGQTEDGDTAEEDADGLTEAIEEAAEEERQRLLEDPEAVPDQDLRPPDPSDIARGAASGAAGGALRGLSVLGAADTMCTAFNLLKAVDYGAKFYRALALVRYAGFFMTFADAIKAGEVTPAQINFIALMLFSTDSEGRNFFDSPGFQYLLYKVPPKESSIANYSTGTTFGGVIGQARRTINNFLGDDRSARRTCGIVSNPIVQIGAGAVSLVAAFFTGGASAAISAAAGAGAGVILGVLQQWAVPMLVQFAAGTVVTGDENGYQIGTAVASGMGAMSGQLSRAGGMRPMTDGEVAAGSAELNQAYNDLFAHKKPSLTEKITDNMSAFAARMMMSPALTTPQQLFGYAGTNISTANVFAVDQVQDSDVCQDPAFVESGTATNAFCTPLFGETKDRIDSEQYDPEAVLRFMLADPNLYDGQPGNEEEAYVTADGEPTGNENGERFKNYRDICMDGTAPMVSFVPEELAEAVDAAGDYQSLLEYCGDTAVEPSMFRFFRMDTNITEEPEALNDEFYNEGQSGLVAATCDGPAVSSLPSAGWVLVGCDDFNGTAVDTEKWHTGWEGAGTGHAGNGRRAPSQSTVAGGILTQTGLPNGDTGWMAWKGGYKYGRWEARMRTDAGCGCYHPVLLLWPDAEDFPVGGEIDYAEIFEPDRGTVNFFLHYGASNSQVFDSSETDATQWHVYAVEWTPNHIKGFIDGEEFFSETDPGKFPPRPMHGTIQLDWFPGGGGGGKMQVDYYHIWQNGTTAP